MFKSKNFLAVLLVLCLMISVFAVDGAWGQANPEGHVTVSVEKFTLGQGYHIEPVNVPYYDGEKVGNIIVRVLGSGNYNDGTNSENISYLDNVRISDNGSVNIPQYILDQCGSVTQNADNWLGQFDYTSMAGWMYIVNNQIAPVGMNQYDCVNGDVIRLQFSVYGYGADIGHGWGSSYIEVANKDSLTKLFADINGREDKTDLLANDTVKGYYDSALVALKTMDATQNAVNTSLQNLENAIDKYDNAAIKTAVINDVLSSISASYTDSSSEWCIMDMVAYGMKDNLTNSAKSTYINNATKMVNTTKKGTDFNKSAIIFTALGLDPREVAATDGSTINVIDKIATASSIDGMNGAAFALLAYDSGNYGVSDKTWTRATIIEEIKSKQHNDGGWSLSDDKIKASDPDVTAMIVSALAPYYLAADDTYTVKSVVDNAITCMSSMQDSDGQFASWNTKNSNSASMIIVALSALGIDADNDSRFIKNDTSAIDALLSYKTTDNKFGYTNNTTVNAMSTEQGFRALVAYSGYLRNKGAFNVYQFGTMSDSVIRPTQTKTITVRIEGISENKLFLEDREIQYSEQLLTAADIVKDVVDSSNYEYFESQYGGYFSSLFGEAAGTFGNDYDGWQYRVNGVSPSVGIDSYNVGDGDELLLYYGGMNIQYPNEPIIKYINGDAIITFTAEQVSYGGAPDYAITINTVPIANATVTWGYGSNETTTFTTNSNGQIKIPSDKADDGNHSLQIEKYDNTEVSGKYLPLVVRGANNNVISLEKQVNVIEGTKEISPTTGDAKTVYNIPSNIDAFLSTTTTLSGENRQSILPAMTVQKMNGSATNFVMDIENGTRFTGNSSWDGKIILPTLVANPTIIGEIVDYAIKVGNDVDLTLNKPARILLPNAKHKRVGFINAAGNFTEITKVMTVDSASGLSFSDKEGKINVGNDLAIWTKHFTQFVVLGEAALGGGGGSPASTDITVKFTLIGDSKHGSPEKHSSFETWISEKSYTVSAGATVKTVFDKALKDAGIPYINKSGDYVSSINGLAEFDNGPNSGWMYKINGKHPNVGLSDYQLKNGDRIVWHYTDDYTKEEGSEQFKGNNPDVNNPETPNNPGTTSSDKKFSDVSGWSEPYVNYLVEKGIVKGKTDTIFGAKDSIKRSELITILARMSGDDLSKYLVSSFSDVPKGSWYEQSIAWAIEKGIVKGYDGKVSPNANISRQDICVMIDRYATNVLKVQLNEVNQKATFSDDSRISDYAKDAVYKIQKANIVNGKNENLFAPTSNASREEAAKILALLLQGLGN